MKPISLYITSNSSSRVRNRSGCLEFEEFVALMDIQRAWAKARDDTRNRDYWCVEALPTAPVSSSSSSSHSPHSDCGNVPPLRSAEHLMRCDSAVAEGRYDSISLAVLLRVCRRYNSLTKERTWVDPGAQDLSRIGLGSYVWTIRLSPDVVFGTWKPNRQKPHFPPSRSRRGSRWSRRASCYSRSVFVHGDFAPETIVLGPDVPRIE